jgi:transposase-like protein
VNRRIWKKYVTYNTMTSEHKVWGFDGKLHCPNCGSPDVRRSHSRGLLDRLMVIFHKSPFRCRQCERRFYSAEVSPTNA